MKNYDRSYQESKDPDEIISNRDDEIYIARLKQANSSGTTVVIIGNDGGHLGPHWTLWQVYSQKIKRGTSYVR